MPGYSGSKEDFGPLLAPLAEAGWRAVALDLRGQHESPGPDEPAAYTVEALGPGRARGGAAHGPVHLVGHSFGGLVCRAAALAGPSGLASLTLLELGTAAPYRPAGRHARVPARGAGVGRARGDRGRVGGAVGRRPGGGRRARAEVTRLPAARWLTSRRPGCSGWPTALRTEPDRVAALRDTRVPVLVLHGQDDDAWLPPVQADMAVRLGADLVVVPGARHSPAAENPDATARALDLFWTSTLEAYRRGCDLGYVPRAGSTSTSGRADDSGSASACSSPRSTRPARTRRSRCSATST